MVAFACLALLIYSIGIPLALFLSLFKWRRELNPPNYEDESRAIKARAKLMKTKKYEALAADPFVPLALPYKPRYWWFEVYSLGRRFALTSLVLAFDSLRSTMVYTTLVAVTFHIMEREWSPEMDLITSNYNYWLSWQLILCLIYM